MGIILAPLSLFLFLIVFIIESIFSSLFETKGRRWFGLVSERMYKKAKYIDIFGNFLFPEFWDFIFSKKGFNYKFGRLGETISSVLGKKKLEESLSKVGLFFYYILYYIDFSTRKRGGHCIASIMSDEKINEFKN